MTVYHEVSGVAGAPVNTTPSKYQMQLKELKARVPSEYATPATVRLWLLQCLKNRKVELLDGPNAFVCLWSGAELHSTHPNHMFGFFTSHGVTPHTAHMVVGDVMECLEDYRARRAACVAAGRVWSPDAVAEQSEQPDRFVDVEREPLLNQDRSPDNAPSSSAGTRAMVLLTSTFFVVAGLGALAWKAMDSNSKSKRRD